MTVVSCSFRDDPLTSEGKREKQLQFKWRFLIVVCAILFTFAISVVASSLLLYSFFCPGSTPAPEPAPTTTTTPPTTTTPWTTTTASTPLTSTSTTTTTSSPMIFTADFISPRNFSGGNIRLIQRMEWGAVPPSEPLRKLETPVQDVIISHTATDFCRTTSECTLRVRFVQTFHMENRGWSDIAYNFLVGGDGYAYVGRGWNSEGTATSQYNHRSISISFIGTFNSVNPSTEQLQTAQDLIKLGVELGKIRSDYSLFGHRQLSATLSPGDALYKIIQTWSHWRALL